MAGDKKSQDADIKKARTYRIDYMGGKNEKKVNRLKKWP